MEILKYLLFLVYIEYSVLKFVPVVDGPPEECDFEENLCDWTSEDSNWKWERKSSESLEGHLGPEQDHDGNKNTFFVYLDAANLVLGDKASLISPHKEFYEGITKCFSFWYMIEIEYAETFDFFLNVTIVEEGASTTLWSHQDSHVQEWVQGQIAINHPGRLQIKFVAQHGESNTGFMALDNFKIETFEAGNNDAACQTLPPNPEDTTPKPCNEGDFQCEDGTCLAPNKVCNFKYDCVSSSSDEENCPELYTFNECQNLTDCHWAETVQDELDWSVATTGQTGRSGPSENFQNTTEGKFLYIMPATFYVKEGIAEIKSPTYQDSSTNCYFNFYAYLSEGPDTVALYPVLRHVDLGYITNLDRLDKNVLEEGKWTKVEIGIGRHRDLFNLGFNLVYQTDVPYSAGVAVDDVNLFMCSLLPEEATCPETEYHCEITRSCVPTADLCDYADNCGDNSDEVFGCQNYTRIDFEDPNQPFGFFRQDDPTPQFKWSRGNGTTNNEGTGPPFDHTLFTPNGHYLYIASDEYNINDKAWLSTPIIRTTSAECHARFFYHMHGQSVGNLTVYRALGALEQVWTAEYFDGIDQNVWKKADIPFSPDDGNDFRLVIEATVGVKQKGDIAIDDFSFTPACLVIQEDTTTTTTKPKPTTTTPKPGEDFTCNFDNDQCGWTASSTETEFNWIRTSSKECKEGGHDCPPNDLSSSEEGYFMYIDGTMGLMDSKALLSNPVSQPPADDCFMFYYDLFKDGGIKALRIKTKESSGEVKVVWELSSGISENVWTIGQVNISDKNIIIEAEKNKDVHKGYAAVDEFLLIPNLDKCDTLPPDANVNNPPTPPPTPSPTPPPTPTKPSNDLPDCDFETDWCGWNADAELNGTEFFIFIRTEGKLHANGEDGPKHDHAENAEAFFLWANAQLGNPGMLTSLSSPIVSTNEKLCMNFWFDMTHNSGIQDLQIYIESTRDLTKILLWEFHEAKLDFWEEGRVEIEKFEEYKVVITAHRGEINQGYVALDDFTFSTKEEFCSIKPDNAVPEITTTPAVTTTTTKPHKPFPNCQFQDGTCGWELFGMEFHWVNTDSQTLAGGGHDAPLDDHAGKFLYAEAKLGVDGESASIRSPDDPEGLNACMLFFYSIYHDGGIRSLKIKTIDTEGKEEYIWDLTDYSQESNSEWMIGQVNVSAQQIVIETVKGDDTFGYVAIDGIFFDDSPLLPNCDILPKDATVNPPTPTPPVLKDCDFETDFCAWHSESGLNSSEQFVWDRTKGSLQDGVSGPLDNHDGKNETFFIWTAAQQGVPGSRTALVSPIISTQSNTCFKFWFDLRQKSGITSLQVVLEHSNNMQNTVWEHTSKLDYWERGQVLIEKGLEFKILVVANHGELKDGYAAVDDFEFLFDSIECDTRPPEPPITTPDPGQCTEGQLECEDGNGCYMMNQHCDFFSDCLDSTDEKGCPAVYLFDNCEDQMGIGNCGWEESPHDNLDWIVATKNETESTGHPVERDGKFLWIKKNHDSIEDALARIHSPEYQNSRVQCSLAFWYYIAGDLGTAFLKPVVHVVEEAKDVILDHFGENNQWSQIVIQIGRIKGPFEVVFEKDIASVFDASVAIDDVGFEGCEMPRPDSGECGGAKPFQCNNKVCIEFELVCDLMDDCGDASDELVTYCHDNHYTRVSFEDDEKPLGIFSLEGSNGYEKLHWQRWSGETSNLHTGPSVDHTTFDTSGHYVYVNSSLREDSSERAVLVSQTFDQSSSDGPECEITLNYFMYGPGVGTLSVSVRPSVGDEVELFSIAGGEVNKNGWQRNRIKVINSSKFSEYVIVIAASVDITNQGDVAIDDITFSPSCRLGGGGSSSTTTATTPQCHPEEQFTCGDGTCIPYYEFCNFHKDCPHDTLDEDSCPDTFTFEDCSNSTAANCGWTRTNPDILDWVVTSLADLTNDNAPHRPEQDYQDKKEGHFLYVKSLMGGSAAGVVSPVYQGSSTYCVFEFYVFLSGSPNFYLYPTLTHFKYGTMTALDMIDLAGFDDGVWSPVAIGIGRQRDEFDVGFEILYTGDAEFDSAVAVDQILFLSCSLPTAEDECQEDEFHCIQTKGCVLNDHLCDFADDCGDATDEEIAYQDCLNYTRMNFEDPINPWGFFNESEESQNFKWGRGNGSVSPGTGPPFDHTTFDPVGHYLYIASNLHNKDEKAWLTTPLLYPVNTACSARFFFHMHGRGVGNLTVYLQQEGAHDMTLLWQQQGMGAGGILDLNEWRRAQIDLKIDSESRLVFEATVGEKELGNIAIDDVSFTPDCLFDYSSITTQTVPTTTTTSTTTTTATTTTTTTTSKTTSHETMTTTRRTTHYNPTTENVTPPPSNPHSHITTIVGVIVGVLVVICLIIAVVVTIKMRYIRVPNMAQVQSYFNPNYNRFDDNNMVSLRELTSKSS